MNDIPRVVLTGGVSGGHTFPLIAVARALKNQFPEGLELLYVGPSGPFEQAAFSEAEIAVRYVATGKYRRYFSFQNFLDVFKVSFGIVQSLWHLLLFMPDAVFAKGGSGSVPVVVAAWLYRIPVMIHDSDAVAGRANRFLARFSRRIAIAYPDAKKYFPEEKVALTGNPVREEFIRGDAGRAAKRLGFSLDVPTVMVIGGSLGAQALNDATLRVLPELLRRGIQVIHQTGSDHIEAVREAAEERGIDIPAKTYVPVSFLPAEEMADAVSLATLVVSRAGAGMIAELAALKKAVILVPLQTAANDEQRMNAFDIAGIGGAIVIEESNLGEHLLLDKISALLGDAALRQSMGEKLSAFYRPDAAETIAGGIRTMIES